MDSNECQPLDTTLLGPGCWQIIGPQSPASPLTDPWTRGAIIGVASCLWRAAERDRGRSGHWPGHPADTGFSYLHTITITVLPSLWLSSQPLSHYLRVRSPIRQRNENRYIFYLEFWMYRGRGLVMVARYLRSYLRNSLHCRAKSAPDEPSWP